jgi:triacylglycerol lipase
MSDRSQHFTGVKKKKSYDPQVSLSLAVACDLAYKPKATIIKTAKSWGFAHTTFINVVKGKDIDTQGYIMSDSTDVICVFRGTDTINDWFSNLQAVRDPGPLKGTKVHEGFQDALYPAVIGFTNALDKMDIGSKRLWITGHSLGGALCSLYSGMLIENGYTIYGIYTFASPRAGDDDFAGALNDAVTDGPHYRVVNDGDVVPHVPPEPFFSHSGKRIILRKNKKRSESGKLWTIIRNDVFGLLMSMTGKAWNVVQCHTLDSDDNSYIPRLILDLQRK